MDEAIVVVEVPADFGTEAKTPVEFVRARIACQRIDAARLSALLRRQPHHSHGHAARDFSFGPAQP
jgi:hypothetical protein